MDLMLVLEVIGILFIVFFFVGYFIEKVPVRIISMFIACICVISFFGLVALLNNTAVTNENIIIHDTKEIQIGFHEETRAIVSRVPVGGETVHYTDITVTDIENNTYKLSDHFGELNHVRVNDDDYSNCLVEYSYEKSFTLCGINFHYNSLFTGLDYYLFLSEDEYNKIPGAQETITIMEE